MTTQKPRVVVFDCFGVVFADAFRALLAEYEHRLPQPVAYYYNLDALNGDGALSDADFYRELSEDTGLPAAELRKRFHDTHCRIEGTVDIARELRASGYTTGLLSNIERRLLDEFLHYKHTGELFDAALASSEVGIHKPDRRIFEAMAERLHAPFETWFFVDDSQANVEAATSYGIASHLFTGPAHLRAELRVRGIL